MEIRKTEYDQLKKYLSCKFEAVFSHSIEGGSAAHPWIDFRYRGDDKVPKVRLAQSLLHNEKSPFWREFIGSFINHNNWTKDPPRYTPDDIPNDDQPELNQSFEKTLSKDSLKRLQFKTKNYLQEGFLKGKVVKIFPGQQGNIERLIIKHWGKIRKLNTAVLETPFSDIEMGNKVEVYTLGETEFHYGHRTHPDWERAILLKNKDYEMHYKAQYVQRD